MVGQRSTGKANPVTQPELWDPCEGRNAACQTVQQFHPKFIPKRLERRKDQLTSRMSPDLLQGIESKWEEVAWVTRREGSQVLVCRM